MSKLLILGNIVVVACLFIIVGLLALLAANIVITVVGADYSTVLPFKELLVFLVLNCIIFIGLVFSLDYYETLLKTR